MCVCVGGGGGGGRVLVLAPYLRKGLCSSWCVCMAVWCSGCVLGSGPEVLEFKPNSGIFHLIFHLPPPSPTSPPSCDWVPGICWGANSRPFLMK